MEGFAVEKLDKIITNSVYLKNSVLRIYHTSEKEVIHLYKSIDFSKINYIPNRSIPTNDSIKILFVKSDYPRGGLKVLMEALALLSDFNFQLTIIGPKEIHRKTILSYLKKASNIQIGSLFYIRIKTTADKYIIHKTLTGFTEELPSNKFIRIHRSYTVAIDKIQSLEGNSVEIDGIRYTIGRSYYDQVKSIILASS